jgi:serine-type D-Ala-D-Ala carboxypeptidase/endopeptidase
MKNLLQKHIKKSSAGVVAALIDDGRIEYVAYGKKSINEDVPVTKESVFEIGSITKVFTATALLDIVHKGKVQLDDPIDAYLPGIKIPQFGDKKITFRHLATHSSQLPPVPDNFDLTNITNPYRDYTVEKLYQFLSSYELPKAPGESCIYSNLGMGLLGHVLSIISQKSYEQLISENICKVLGMENTGITLTPKMEKNKARSHRQQQEVEYWDFSVLAGCGALRSDAQDMARFLAANMGVIKTSFADVFKQCHEVQFSFPGEGAMALGWQISNRGIITHMGGTGGSLSFIGFNPKNQKGLVLLSNSTDFFSDDLTIGLLDPENYIPEKPVDEAFLAIDYLKLFEGAFETLQTEGKQETPVIVNFGVYGTDLWVWLSTGEKAVLIPETFGVFCPRGFPDGYRSCFIFDDNKNILKVQIIRPDGMLEAVPKK